MVRETRWDDPWRRFPVSTPLPVQGGLATSRQRGSLAESWWSRRFVEVLESYGLGTRLQRGRRYARQGQILSMDVSAGLIAAQVQGSRTTPYLVTIAVPTPTNRQWQVVDAALRQRVGLTAHLLAGEVPAELEGVFDAARAPLFPRGWQDLSVRCSCPDSANPCKHIAAVLYLFGDRLDTDPWLLLEWRGRSRDDILAALGLQAAPGSDELPPWWPLTPGTPLPPQKQAPLPDIASHDVPEPAHAVLDRLDELHVVAWRAPASDVVARLYAIVLDQP